MNRALESLGIIKQFLKNNRLYWYYEQEFHIIEEELTKKDELNEELGCPVEVVFKALKEGIYHNGKFEHPVLILDEDSFKKNNLSLLVVGTIVYLKEYKKTWWLREDKSE